MGASLEGLPFDFGDRRALRATPTPVFLSLIENKAFVQFDPLGLPSRLKWPLVLSAIIGVNPR